MMMYEKCQSVPTEQLDERGEPLMSKVKSGMENEIKSGFPFISYTYAIRTASLARVWPRDQF